MSNKFIYFLSFLIITIIAFLIASYGGSVTEKKLSLRNPTSYIFNISKEKLRKTITLVFSSQYSQSHPLNLKFKDSLDGRFYLTDFSVLNGKERAQLIPSSPWLSDVYFYKEKRAMLNGRYLVELFEVSDGKVRISIEANDLKAYTGSYFFSSFFASHGGARMVDVKSTTIEEYIFIIRIASHLGINLPPVKIPEAEKM